MGDHKADPKAIERRICRPEYVYVRTTFAWRFWAIGYHTMPTKSRKFTILTVALGPARLQFLKWDDVARHRAESLLRQHSKETVHA